LSKEIMYYQSGIGYNNIINQQRYGRRENENIAIHYIDETVIRVGREEEVVWLWMDCN